MKLSPRMLQVVLLVGRDDLSWKAVARELEISEHTAREYALRVRKRLDICGHSLKADLRAVYRTRSIELIELIEGHRRPDE